MRRAAFRALALARREDITFEAAAGRLGRNPHDLVGYVAKALVDTSGGLVPSETDSLSRRMLIIEDDGVHEATIDGSRRAQIVARHWRAAWRMRDTGDESALPDTPVPIARGRYLTADPDVIDELAYAGDLDVPDIYVAD